jgi:hypothetical protein
MPRAPLWGRAVVPRSLPTLAIKIGSSYSRLLFRISHLARLGQSCSVKAV